MKKRLLASLLSLAMLLTMLPVTAFAADDTGISITKGETTTYYTTLEKAIDAADDGDVISVTKDISESSLLSIPAGKTIQINGVDSADSPAKISTSSTWIVNGALGLGKNLTLNLSGSSSMAVANTGYIVVGTVPGSNVTIEGDGLIQGKGDRPIRVVEGDSPAESTADNAEEDGAENVFDPVLKLDTTFSSPNYYPLGLRAGQVIIGENAKLDVKSIFVGDMGIDKTGKRGNEVALTEDCTLDVYGTVTNNSTPATTGKKPWEEEATITTYGVVKDKTMTINIHDGATVKNKFTSALYLPASGSYTIGDETAVEGKNPPVIEGGTAAIGLKSGPLTINGGTITATTAASNEMESWNNGINENGSAIVIESNKGYKGDASVTVKDAVITGAANAFYFISKSGEPGTNAAVTLTIEKGTFRSPGYTFGMTEATPSTPPTFPVIEITDGTFTNYVPEPTESESEPESNIDKVEAYVTGENRACRVSDDGDTFSVVDITPLGGAAVTLETGSLSKYSPLPEGTTDTPNVTVTKTEWFKGESPIEGPYFNTEGSDFKAKVTVTPDHGYTFSKDAKFTVNGKETTPESFDETADEDRVLPVTDVMVQTEAARSIVNVTLKAASGVDTSPLESIDVAIYNRAENADEDTAEPIGEPIETGKTDNTGKVTFAPGFVRGNYIAVVAAKGGEYAHSTATFDLPPESGTETDVELTLQAPAERKTVNGFVYPLVEDTKGITVTFTDANGDPWTTTTDNSSTFSIDLPVGTYAVTIGGTNDYDAFTGSYTVEESGNHITSFTMPAKAATTFTVSGTVSAGDTGLTDLSGLIVTLTGEGIKEQTANVGAEGNYTFTDVPNGTYTLTIAAGEGYKEASVEVTVNGEVTTAPAITLEKPAESTPETSESEPSGDETSESEPSGDETSESEPSGDETSESEPSGDETSETEIQSVEIDIDESDIEVGDPFPTPTLTTKPANAAKISTTWRDESDDIVTSAVSAGLYTATFVITPNKGYKFGEGTSYTINDDTKGPNSLTVLLNVAEKPATQYRLNIPQPENGAVAALVNGEPASTAAADDTVTLDITPDDGYKLLSVVVDGVVLDPEDLTFTMPAANVDIQVTFVEEQKVVAEVDPINPAADTVAVSATPAEGDIKNQIESGTEAFVEITTGAIQDESGNEVEIPTDKPATVEVKVPQEDSEALKQSNKGLNVEIPNVITAEVPAEPLSDILADKPENEGVVFVCDRETVETDKAVFEIGFETTSGTKLPYTANSGLITLKVKVPFAPTTRIVITSEGKPVANRSEQEVAADGTVTFGTDHMSPFEFTKASAVVVPSDDYEITYPYRGSAKISINAVANEQYIIQVTVEGKAVPFVTTAPNTTTNPTLDVNAPIGSKVEVWRVPAGDDPFTALGAVGPTAEVLVNIKSVPAEG